ncbi:hypothetical protein ZEAMMB73_Zm00001d035843, partial [Zea mays]
MNHTGLSLESRTGDIAVDDSYWGTQEGDPSPQGNRGKPPPFLDELYTLFGRTTHNRGNLISVGGVREPSRSYGSHDTPDDGVGCSNTRSSSKRFTEATVDSPPKKNMSLEDHIANISESISIRNQRTLSRGQEEVDEVVRLLKEDGLEEDSDLYCMANILCKNDINRRFFLHLKSNSEMSSVEDSSHSDTASDDSSNIFQQAGAAAVLDAFTSSSYTLAPMINLHTPLPHVTGRQW